MCVSVSWDQVVFSKGPTTQKQAKSKTAVATAARNGTLEVDKKEFRPGNKAGVITNAKKLDEDMETYTFNFRIILRIV